MAKDRCRQWYIRHRTASCRCLATFIHTNGDHLSARRSCRVVRVDHASTALRAKSAREVFGGHNPRARSEVLELRSICSHTYSSMSIERLVAHCTAHCAPILQLVSAPQLTPSASSSSSYSTSSSSPSSPPSSYLSSSSSSLPSPSLSPPLAS